MAKNKAKEFTRTGIYIYLRIKECVDIIKKNFFISNGDVYIGSYVSLLSY